MDAPMNSSQSPPFEASLKRAVRINGDHPSNGVKEATHYVLGGDHVGTAIAERLQSIGHRVAVVDNSHESREIPGFAGDAATVDVLSESGVGTASTVVVATPSDPRNLLIAQLLRARFDVPRVIPFVHEPDRVPLFADSEHEPFCVTTALAAAVDEAI